MDARSEVANAGPYRTAAVMPKAPRRKLSLASIFLGVTIGNIVLQGFLNLIWFAIAGSFVHALIALFMFVTTILFGYGVRRIQKSEEEIGRMRRIWEGDDDE